MEEISSLDTLHTDVADTLARPESAPLEKPATPTEVDATKEDSSKDVTAITTNEEDFEHISDGLYEVDDTSRPTSAVQQLDESTQDKIAFDECIDEDSQSKDQLIADKEDQADNDKTTDETNDVEKSADFEEVDANVSANATIPTDESDMLGESDMTLPTNITTEEDEIANKSDMIMEVDNIEEDHDDIADVEMLSLSNSPQVDKVNTQTAAEEDDMQQDISDIIETLDEESISVLEGDDSSGKDVVDDIAATEAEAKEKETETETETNEENDTGEAIEAIEALADAEVVQKETETEEIADKTTTTETEENENVEEDEVEHEDEPVENVQEPEESDICLIPDDTETQMTDDEKKQAILARENAEKEDAAAEAELEKEKKEAELEKVDKETADSELEETGESAANESNAVADAPDPDEPLLEEMQSSTTGATSKIIIGWIIGANKTCKQCDEEKKCGFRYKNPETSENHYVCSQTCCETIISNNPGKYFIRRKKFLVEELSNELAKSANNEATTEHAVAPYGASNKAQCCLNCKETKLCKYFFKQDDDHYYICSDSCFSMLNTEEPEKFKLKRHSIRVRNIGATISTNATPAKKVAATDSRVVARTAAEAETARMERVASFSRLCAECFTEVELGDKNLLWETMDFCNEICLGKYQRTIGANCQTCNGEVPHQALGKYCVRFGFDIRQFCCAACLNEFKKGLKTCSCCQKDISSGNEGFLAPVGDKEQFKDFCSQNCLKRYDIMCNPKKKLRNAICAVCNHDKPVRVEILLDDKEHNFCSNPCFSAFKFVSNIIADQCGMCCKYFERKGRDSYTIYTEVRAKVFCSRICLNVYIIVNRRIVSCQWCKVKKYNFDMIYKQQDAREVLMCSLNCLTLYGMSINAFTRTVSKCDNCDAQSTPQYHLTMSDASMRNFCTYQCVMQFQNQFARAPLTLESDSPTTTQTQQTQAINKNSAPFPTGLPKRVKLKLSQQMQQKQLQIKLPVKKAGANNKGPTVPVISTVSSLASGETETMIGSVTVRRSRGQRTRKLESPPPPPSPVALPNISNASNNSLTRGGRGRKAIDYARTPSPVTIPQQQQTTNKRPTNATQDKASGQTETKIITVPPYPPMVRNVMTSCKPQTCTVGFQTEPTTTTTATQTGKDYSNKILIPVPVPIFIPQPMYMYSAPFPVPVPIPLPIPVPIFIPTTRNSAQGILKEIKKIQDKMPADPFEAELLMMAEMVAEEKRESDSDSEDEIKPDPGVVSLQYDNSVQQEEVGNHSYGEDVLQMAIKMASGEYDQPSVDLESAMTANTITNPPPGMVAPDDSMGHMAAHHMQQHPQHMMEAQRGGRGRKRGALASPVSPRNSRSPVKRQRIQEMEHSPQPNVQPMQVIDKPDANMCLKYTFGVNAWKQWVVTKNADIEKSSIRRRTFKTDLLQMTADELNYSLCLFVKEVRKPNGTEYAPDTIYYLVLGIQQYLYENGRIDNIFTDPYYERFTDCLDEVARKFSVLYNDSQYIVTRVEEEHLWECKQLGAHSPHVLLSTLMFFNTKHFNLTTVEEHMQLSFSHIMKHWKRSAQATKTPGPRNVLLRFYPPQAGLDANPRKKKVYEQQENEENPLRCPVRLYEFYLSKCPESVKTRNDVFYLQPERSCVPDSPVWYSTQALSQESLQKMLHRVKMVKEINIALLTS